MHMKQNRRMWIFVWGLGMLCTLGVWAAPKPAALLPRNAVAMMTIPDMSKAKAAFLNDPYIRLFSDPAMKGYAEGMKEIFVEKLWEQLEKRLNVQLTDYADLIQGQITVALFVEMRVEGLSFDVLIAMDSGDQSEGLAEKFEAFRNRLSEEGQVLKPMTIRDHSFFRVQTKASQGLPNQWFMGQVDSFLMIASRLELMQKSLAAGFGGGSSLAEDPAFSRIFSNRFKDSYVYGWVNFAEIYQRLILPQVLSMDRRFARNPNPFAPKPKAILDALGLESLQGLAFNMKRLAAGSMMEFALAVPKESRDGLFGLMNFEEKDCMPLPQISDKVVSFNRVRFDLSRSWNDLENTLINLVPFVASLDKMFLEGLGKDKNPNFDFRESFFENLGDDIITIGFPPRSSGLNNFTELTTPPSLTLLGSPRPKELAEAIIVVVSSIPSNQKIVKDRSFQGRTIYTIRIPGLPMPGTPPGQNPFASTTSLYMAADDGYVIFSMDEQMMEDYLRGVGSNHRPLSGVSGLSQAKGFLSQTPLTSFRYDNATILMKGVWEWFRENADSQNPEIRDAFGLSVPNAFWLDWSAAFADLLPKLPPFERVAKYFHYSVGGTSSDAHYLNYRWFFPTPPGLK